MALVFATLASGVQNASSLPAKTTATVMANAQRRASAHVNLGILASPAGIRLALTVLNMGTATRRPTNVSACLTTVAPTARFPIASLPMGTFAVAPNVENALTISASATKGTRERPAPDQSVRWTATTTACAQISNAFATRAGAISFARCDSVRPHAIRMVTATTVSASATPDSVRSKTVMTAAS